MGRRPADPGAPLALDASGAALSGDGRQLVVARAGAAEARELVAIDVRSGVGPLARAPPARDALPLSGAAGVTAGMEVVGADVAIGRAGRVPTPLALDDDAASFTLPDREVQP